MTQRYQALTEKEKETLRLLVNGYDAKSMARHLGLSVHTINERLRNARRKMVVSSSREAARLLHEVEGRIPELLGDKDLGDAATTVGMEQLRHQIGSSGKVRRADWVIGGVVMSLTLALFTFASLSGGGHTAAIPPTVSAAETAAVDAARRWLALVDARDWDASWQATGKAFKSLNTNARWAEVSKQASAPLGTMLSRELTTINFAPAPPHGYWIVKFRTSYTNKADVVETVSLVSEDGSWKVVGIMLG